MAAHYSLDSWAVMGYPMVNVNKKRWKDPPCLMGNSTISVVMFNSYVKLSEGIWGKYGEIAK